MQSRRVIVRGRRPTSLITLRWQIACLGMVLSILSAWPTLVGAGPEGFVVLPDSAPRFSGPIGREADTFEILATREQTGGAMGLFRVTVAPKSGPGVHIHRGEDEFLYVLKGEFHFKHGDRIVSAPAGHWSSSRGVTPTPFKTSARSPASYWGA